MTSSDDVKLPFPLEVSQSVSDKHELTNESTSSTSAVDLGSPDDDCSVLVQQAQDSVSQIFTNLIEQLQVSNETLRRERDTALDQVNELSQQCGQLASQNHRALHSQRSRCE